MKPNFAAIAIFSLCLTITALAQQANLEGHVYEIVNNKETPVAGVRVISPGGQSKETDSKGHFIVRIRQAGLARREKSLVCLFRSPIRKGGITETSALPARSMV
jgi:hypothetical protein